MRNLIVGLAWLSPFVPIVLWPHTRIYGFVIMAALHALWLYPTLAANVQWFGPVVTHFATDAREIWLTIDDGPTDDTPQLLELLATRSTRATFFLKGVLAQRRPDLVQAIVAAGHSIGNHSYSHPSGAFWCLPPSWIEEEIDRCNAVIGDVRHFRAPVGMKNPAVHPALTARGMRLIGWSVRGFDTVTEDPERVAARIAPQIHPGAIVVMHQGLPHAARCIERVIDDVQRAGYGFIIPADARLKTNR
ncbi:MAG TPA: polysaccharide deacetylase family protein [Thermoanaerobaculia bacterium]|nr:polysaccharide deacetylase family protein [Thermoanaerobaculia bacterium]